MKKAVEQSNLPNKDILIGHFNRTIGSHERANRAMKMNSVLAFGKYTLNNKKREQDYRLYARLTLAIKGFILKKEEKVDTLKNKFATQGAYGMVEFAKREYEKQRIRLWLEFDDESFEIEASEELQRRFGAREGYVLDFTRNAGRIAKNVIAQVVKKLDSSAEDVKHALELWFGGESKRQVVKANFKAIQDRLNCTHNKIKLKVVGKGSTWAYVNGTPNTIFLANPFFDPQKIKQTSTFAKGYKLSVENIKWLRDASKIEDDIKFYKAHHISKNINFEGNLRDYLDTKIVTSMKNAKERLVNNELRILKAAGFQPQFSCQQTKEKLRQLVTQKRENHFKRNPSLAGNPTGYGVLIHELSHLVLDTKDLPNSDANLTNEGKCYGALLCSFLADENPEKAINNADNYRLFAQSFGPQM